MARSESNTECLCGHLEEFHDESGWCDQTGCVCSFYDPVEDEWAVAGMHITESP